MVYCCVILRVLHGYSSCLCTAVRAIQIQFFYDPVQCGVKKMDILRCGSWRSSQTVNLTVRFSAVFTKSVYTCCGSVLWFRLFYTLRFGAVFRTQRSYGAVGCRFRFCKTYCAVRCCSKSYGAVRCGSPLNSCCYGAWPIPGGKTVSKPCFPYGALYEQTVHNQRWFRTFLKFFFFSVHYRNH